MWCSRLPVVSAGDTQASQLGGGGARVQPLQLDVASAECVRTVAAAVERDEAGGLDALVNNASVLLVREGVELGEVVEPTLTVNVDGAIKVTETFAPLLADNGRIVMYPRARALALWER